MAQMFDSMYVTGFVDFITKSSYEMLGLYLELKNQTMPKEDDMEILGLQYKSVMMAILNYYEYLETHGVTAENAYLTSWFDKNCFNDYYTDIDRFLYK